MLRLHDSKPEFLQNQPYITLFQQEWTAAPRTLSATPTPSVIPTIITIVPKLSWWQRTLRWFTEDLYITINEYGWLE